MATMAPWIDDPNLKDWEKEDIWDRILSKHPMMEYSPIFEAGYENWDPYNEENQRQHGRWASLLDKSISRFQPGETLGGSAIDYLNTIRIEDAEDIDYESTTDIIGHEIPHLGMRLDTPSFLGTINPLNWKNITKEENLNRMHDLMYQPTSYMTRQQAIPNLMNKGYIEQTNIPGGLSYVGDPGGDYGYQHTGRGDEFVRTSGLPENFQRALGYVEPSRTVNAEPVRRAFTPDPNEGRHHFNTGGLASLVI